jgi:hypothetical protein
MEERRFPELPFTLGSKAGAAGWSDGREAVQTGALVVAQTHYEYPEEDLIAFAAVPAKRYMQQIVERLGLTPRQGVNMFAVYIHAYLNGALDAAANQAGQSRE